MNYVLRDREILRSATRLSMVLSGNWRTRGVLEVFLDGEPVDCIDFPPAPWAVLAQLFMAAIDSQSTHWFNAFVTTAELVQELEYREIFVAGVPQAIHKSVNALRARLADTEIRMLTEDASLSGKEWAIRVIQTSNRTGYRIAIPPENLTLFIDGAEYKGKGG